MDEPEDAKAFTTSEPEVSSFKEKKCSPNHLIVDIFRNSACGPNGVARSVALIALRVNLLVGV